MGNYEIHYGVIQGYAIKLSPIIVNSLKKCETDEETFELLGNCIFSRAQNDDFLLILPEEMNEDNGWE